MTVVTKEYLLKELATAWDNCTKCPLHECNTPTSANPSGRASGRGNPDAKVLLVGEALGKQESQTGIVFHPDAPAGSKLQQILSFYNLYNPDTGQYLVYISNPVICRSTSPRGKDIKPTIKQYRACQPRFQELVSIMQPELIVAMGAGALEALTGQKHAVTRVMGELFETQYGNVLATVHPMYYRYNSKDEHLKRTSHKVWQYIRDVANKGG